MSKKSRAVVIGQVFIYIIAIIVFAVVLIFGYQAISGFLEKGEKVAYVTFTTDLQNTVKNVYSDVGTVVIYNDKNPFPVPSQYQEVCFVDLDMTAPVSSSSFCQRKPIICDAWETANDKGGYAAGDQNVFLEPRGLSPIKVYRIALDADNDGSFTDDDGYLCLNVTYGRIDMRLEGLGDRTLISKE
jgi:hypothetical protein